jgi:hypothetical protein
VPIVRAGLRGWPILAAVLAAAAVAGCAGDTTLLVEVVDQNPGVTFAGLQVRVFDPHGLIAHADVAPVQLPGALTVRKLPAESELIRVVVQGTGAQPALGAASAMSQPHGRAVARIDLTTSASDHDGDGVPDGVDNCPDVPNPDQASGSGGLLGDACGGGVDLAVGDQAMVIGNDGPQPVGSTDMATQPGADLAMAPVDMAGVLLDETFDNNTIDPTKWTITTGNGGQVTIANGVVTLRAPAAANAYAEIASVATFGVGTTMTAHVHWNVSQLYDEKGSGFANKRITDSCGSNESEAAMFRGMNFDLLLETATGINPKCQPYTDGQEVSPYAAGDRVLVINRLSASQVTFIDNGKAPFSTTAFVSSANLPVRFGVFTSTANPSASDVIMTVDSVRVTKN